MIWSNEVLNRCAVIRVASLFPRVIHLSSARYGFDNIFMVLSREDGKYIIYKDIGYEMSDTEKRNLNSTLEKWDSNKVSFCNDSTIRIVLPESMQVVLSSFDEIGGSRITPDILILDGDMYLQVEFDSSVNAKVSRNIMKSLELLDDMNVSIVYYGSQETKSTYLFNLYKKNKNLNNDLIVIRTKWLISDKEREETSMGLFLNHGKILPRFISNMGTSEILFRGTGSDFRGSATNVLVNQSLNLYHVTVNSNFFVDFYKNVVQYYYGAIFYMLEITEREVLSFYIVEKNLFPRFIIGIENQWNETIRKEHRNFIISVETVTSLVR